MPELDADFAFFERTLGFVPNSLLTMARRPALARGLIALSRGVYDPNGEVDRGLKRLIGHAASWAAILRRAASIVRATRRRVAWRWGRARSTSWSRPGG